MNVKLTAIYADIFIMIQIFRALTIFSLVVLQTSIVHAQACATCENSKASQQKNLSELSQIAKSALSQDIGKFCQDTAWGALDYSVAPQSIQIHSNTEKRKEAAANYNINRSFGYMGPWHDSLVPNMNFRGNLFQKSCRRHPYCAPIGQMREYITSEKEIPFTVRRAAFLTSLDPTQVSAKFDQKYSSPDFSFTKTFACAGVTVLSSLECAKGLDIIVAYATPIKGYADASVSAVPSYKKIVDKKYLKGAQRAALLVLERFEKTQVEPNANVFDDIYESYRKEGMSHKDADDAAWEIMAIIGAGGPNAGPRFVSFPSTPDLEPLKWAISAIAIAIPKLDLMSTPSGHPYSMPREVSTTCDIGKPYHFWMTAYLSRKLVKDGISPKGAASAAYLAQKAYEIKSNTSGRDPNRAFTTDSYGSWNNVLRIDTAFSSAGAVFGANRAQNAKHKLNIDNGLKEMIQAGSFQPKLSKAEAEALWKKQYGPLQSLGKRWDAFKGLSEQSAGIEAYDRWNQIINSDTAFDLQLKSLED